MKILFVRHGKSLANAAGMVGTPDSPLAEEGIVQARITGQDLRSQNVTCIVCSSYIRAQQTAEIIAGELGIYIDNIHVVDELHERRMGELEGHLRKNETFFTYMNDIDFGFESRADLIARSQVALEKIKQIAAATTGTTVVVAHAPAGLYLLQVAKGKTRFEDFDSPNKIDNAEFMEMEITA